MPQVTSDFMARFVSFINTADTRMADELISARAIFHVPGCPEPISGPAGYLDIIAMMRSGFPDIQWALEETITEGDRIAARFTMRGTHRGSFLGVPASGKTIAVQAINFYGLEHGKIVHEQGQPDFLTLLQQIGGMPTP